MWRSLGQFILKYRLILLLILVVATAFMTWHASKVELSYEFARAIPTDHPKYKEYQEFRAKFGEEGNLLVIGIQTDQFFSEKLFNDYVKLQGDLKNIHGVEDIIAVPASINLVKDSVTEKLKAVPIFENKILSQAEIDSAKNIFLGLP